jgi:hypothetical protein
MEAPKNQAYGIESIRRRPGFLPLLFADGSVFHLANAGFLLRVVAAGSLLLAGLPGSSLQAQEAQWRGPARNGVFPDTALLKEWPEDGPGVLFVSEDIGRGFSSAVATESMIYVTGMKDSTEYLSAIDLKGKTLWQVPYGKAWNRSLPDARCTPAVEDDRAYVLTGLDRMSCIHAITGKEIWSVDIHDRFDSHWDMFGVSESPFLVGNKVIVTPAGETTTVIAPDGRSVKEKFQDLTFDNQNHGMLLVRHGEKVIVYNLKS